MRGPKASRMKVKVLYTTRTRRAAQRRPTAPSANPLAQNTRPHNVTNYVRTISADHLLMDNVSFPSSMNCLSNMCVAP